jgi:hypothetical protein
MFQSERDLSGFLRGFGWRIRAKQASKEICVRKFLLFENVHTAQKATRDLL